MKQTGRSVITILQGWGCDGEPITDHVLSGVTLRSAPAKQTRSIGRRDGARRAAYPQNRTSGRPPMQKANRESVTSA
jgi:hypothetical protein